MSVLNEADTSLRSKQKEIERKRLRLAKERQNKQEREEFLLNEETKQRKWLIRSNTPPPPPPAKHHRTKRTSKSPLTFRKKTTYKFRPINFTPKNTKSKPNKMTITMNEKEKEKRKTKEMNDRNRVGTFVIDTSTTFRDPYLDTKKLRQYISSSLAYTTTKTAEAITAATHKRKDRSTNRLATISPIQLPSNNNEYNDNDNRSGIESELLEWLKSLNDFDSMHLMNSITRWRRGMSNGYVAASIVRNYYPNHIHLLNYNSSSMRKLDKIANWELFEKDCKKIVASNTRAIETKNGSYGKYNNNNKNHNGRSMKFNLTRFQKAVKQGRYQRINRRAVVPRRIGGGRVHDQLVDGTIDGIPGCAVSMLEEIHFFLAVVCGVCDTISSMKIVSNVVMDRIVEDEMSKDRMIVSVQKKY